jgi:hypothetical protein
MQYFLPEHWGWQIRLRISVFTVPLAVLASISKVSSIMRPDWRVARIIATILADSSRV